MYLVQENYNIRLLWNYNIMLSFHWTYRSELHYGPWLKSGFLLVFENKVLLKHGHTHWFTYCPRLLLSYNSKVESLQSLKYFLFGPSQKKFPDPILDNNVSLEHSRSISPLHGKNLLEMKPTRKKKLTPNITEVWRFRWARTVLPQYLPVT